MATEKERGPGTNKQGEEHLELLPNSAPRVLNFNEKTGKATRESHLNAPADAAEANQALSAPDADGEFAASHAHNEFAPLPIPDVSERVTVDIDANGDSRVFAAPGASPENLRLQPAADSVNAETRIMIDQAPAPSTRVQAPGAGLRSQRELVTDTSASVPTAPTAQENEAPQIASTVFAPVPAEAQHSALQQTAEHPAGRSAATPGNSKTGASAPEFVPGLPVTPTIVYALPEVERTPSPAQPEPPPEGRAPALNKAPASLPGKRQEAKSAAAAEPPHSPGEQPRAAASMHGALAPPEDPRSPGTPGTTTLSISAAAVERLHAEEKITLELNRQLDQLAARMKAQRQ